MPGLTPSEIARRCARRIRTLPALAVLAAAWSFLIVYAFPGQMTQDSFDHLREARDGIYTDGHPPAINLLWSVVDYAVAGPLGMLVLQSAGMVAGLYLVFRRVAAPRGAAWLTAAVFVFPPVMMPFAVIWKDCFMAAFLVLGIAALRADRRGVRMLGLAAMFGATAVRYNAIAATLPLIVLLFEWQPGMHWLKRYALASVAWIGVTLAAFGFNGAITDKPMHIWHSSLAVYDIVGTLAFLDEDLPDAELAAHLAGTQLLIESNIHARARALYDPRDFLPIILDPKQPLWHLPLYGYDPAPKPQRDAISRAWWETISAHPVEYLEHRLTVMGHVLSITERRPAGAITRRTLPLWTQYAQNMGLSSGWSTWQLKLTRLAQWVWKHTPIFLPWIYVLASLVLLPLAFRQRDVLAVVLSGLSFEGGLLVLAPSPDYRYSHWMIVCTIVAWTVWFARRRAARQLRPAANTQQVVGSQASAQ